MPNLAFHHTDEDPAAFGDETVHHHLHHHQPQQHHPPLPTPPTHWGFAHHGHQHHYDNHDDDDDNGPINHDDFDDHDAFPEADDEDEPVTPTEVAALSVTATSATGPAGRKPRSGKNGASGAKTEIFVCPEVHCGKTFPRSFALRRHLRIHTGTKPYACDFDGCTQRFNTSGNLSRHKRIHSGERPYPCVFENCGKRFNTSTKLKRHMRIHFPEGQNLFQCVQSGCVFACDNYKEYVHHQRQHGNPAFGFSSGIQDENLDESNHPELDVARNGTSGITKQRKPAKPRAVKPKKTTTIPPPVAPPPARFGDYITGLDHGTSDRRLFGVSTSSPPPSGISLLIKEAQRGETSDLDAEFPLEHHRRAPLLKPQHHHHQPSHEDRPRLPFPTDAFPSESIVTASPMNSSSSTNLFGSTGFGIHHHHSQHHSHHHHGLHSRGPSSFYESSSSSSSSSFPYLRGEPSFGATFHDSSMQFRPEDSDEYDSSSPRSSTHHHPDEDVKYAYGSSAHTVGPDFTGEELSAVLELMKDS